MCIIRLESFRREGVVIGALVLLAVISKVLEFIHYIETSFLLAAGHYWWFLLGLCRKVVKGGDILM